MSPAGIPVGTRTVRRAVRVPALRINRGGASPTAGGAAVRPGPVHADLIRAAGITADRALADRAAAAADGRSRVTARAVHGSLRGRVPGGRGRRGVPAGLHPRPLRGSATTAAPTAPARGARTVAISGRSNAEAVRGRRGRVPPRAGLPAVTRRPAAPRVGAGDAAGSMMYGRGRRRLLPPVPAIVTRAPGDRADGAIGAVTADRPPTDGRRAATPAAVDTAASTALPDARGSARGVTTVPRASTAREVRTASTGADTAALAVTLAADCAALTPAPRVRGIPRNRIPREQEIG